MLLDFTTLPAKRKSDDFDDYHNAHRSLTMPRRCFPRTNRSTLQHHRNNDHALHFFVRLSSRTIVVHADPDDTVNSVLTRIGLPASEFRFIYRGRQLDDSSKLSDYDICTDSILHLTARLRSTCYPRAWQIANDIIAALSSVATATSPCRLVREFLTTTPCPSPLEDDQDPAAHLEVFISAGAATALVKSYLSRESHQRSIAERAIRVFLVSECDFFPRYVQIHCTNILLEFCRLLAGTAGRNDALYLSCRARLASLLESQDSNFYREYRQLIIRDIFPFVMELAAIVIQGVSETTVLTTVSELLEFSQFLMAIKCVIKSPISSEIHVGSNPRFEESISLLYSKFMELLERVDLFLKKVEDSVAQKGLSRSEAHWTMWTRVLDVLTEVNVFSKIYAGAKELLHSVLLTRRLSLNVLLRRAKRNVRLRWILKHKDVIDFEARRNLVLMLFPDRNGDYEELHEMLIDRSQLLAESFEYIMQAEASALHSGLFMEFKNEEATGPGVLREWFCLVCREMFNPPNILFLPCPNDRRRFFPNPTSVVDPLHRKYFTFCGRIIALALMHNVQVGIVFDKVFFLQLADKIITLEDVKDADPYLYTSCKKVLEMDADLLDSDVLGLTFVRETEQLGVRKSVDLCLGGKEIVVNSSNREEYVNLLVQHCFVTSISEQVNHFKQGFGDILACPTFKKCFFKSLDLEDFDKMLGGSADLISIIDWKAHTEYDGYQAKDRQICWFWKILENMSTEQQRVLLFFWTSVKFLPVDGFGGLASKLYIYRSQDSNDRLPTSHTCFYRLNLPPYSSIAMMREKLQFIAQEYVSCSFGIW